MPARLGRISGYWVSVSTNRILLCGGIPVPFGTIANSSYWISGTRINPIRPIYTGFYCVRVNWMIRASVPKYCVVSYQISGNHMILFLSNSYDNIYWILCFYPANFGLHIRDNPTITIPSMPQQTNSKGYFTTLFSKEVHLSCNFHIINIILI